MKIEIAKPINKIKEISKEIGKKVNKNKKPVLVTTGLVALGGITLTNAGCGETTVYTDRADVYGAKPAITSPVPNCTESTEQAYKRGVIDERARAQKEEAEKAQRLKEIQEAVDKALAEERAKHATSTPSAPATVYVPQPGYVSPETPCDGVDWGRQLASSEICQPTWGNVLERPVGHNQIGMISGGPMSVNYVDQYGRNQTAYFAGGYGRVTLVMQLSDSCYDTAVTAKNVVTRENWVGIYNMPNSATAQDRNNWQSLLNAKIQETMTQSSSVPGGARTVDVIVLNPNKQIAYQDTIRR